MRSAIGCITRSPVAARPGPYFDLLDHNAHAEDAVTSSPSCTNGWGELP